MIKAAITGTGLFTPAESISNDELTPETDLEVSVKVTNNGAMKAKEVVQLYIKDNIGSVTRPHTLLNLLTILLMHMQTYQSWLITCTYRYKAAQIVY